MNERIKELINQSYLNVQSQNGRDITYFDKEKFAELIVRECCAVADEAEKSDVLFLASKFIKIHFGVEE